MQREVAIIRNCEVQFVKNIVTPFSITKADKSVAARPLPVFTYTINLSPVDTPSTVPFVIHILVPLTV
jgi:hypothetical protein